MNVRKRDYYDLPAAWRPSSNFANRPVSEISDIMMDETFMISSSSSSSSLSEAEDLPNSRYRISLRSPVTPTIKLSFSDEEEQRPRGRNISNDVNIADRPRLRKKSATAPPGGMSVVPAYAPRPPRRAISARSGEMEIIQGRTPQQQTYVMDPLATRRVFDRKQSDIHPQLHHSSRVPPSRPPRSEDISRMDSQLTIRGTRLSFSQKARVRKTLEGKNIGQLNTRIVDFESRGILSSPASLLHTPRDLYPIPEKRTAGQEHSRPSYHEPYSPHSIDARRSILSNLSPQSPQSRRPRPRKKGKKRSQPEKQRVYVPGPIRLEEHHAQPRKGSVASLDPFAGWTSTRGKRYSEMIVLNSLTMYFAELSVLEDATEQCLDRYWRDTKPPASRHVAGRTRPSVASISSFASIEEIPIHGSPRLLSSAWSTRGSRFSVSSASSSSTTAPMRQRDRLKRLLTSGFSSSGK